MYYNLAQRFSTNKRVQFIINEGALTYVDILNTKVRFIHGFQISFGGGIGGVTVPLLKAIAGWDRGIKADITVLGHFHQYQSGSNYCMNGSMIGYSAYAQHIKASPEPPQQAFFLIDKDYGKTVSAPIILTGDK